MPQNPPPNVPVLSFPTPDFRDVILVEEVSTEVAVYKPLEYGAPHPNSREYPEHKLVFQAPSRADRWVRRVYARDRADQDLYNFAIKYSGNSAAHEVYIRSYVFPREENNELAMLSADPVHAGAVLVEQEQLQSTGTPEIDGLYVKVVRVYERLPGPWIPETRYEDITGPIQLRRRAVANTGQVASLDPETATKVTYASRDGSSIVLWELEESKSIPDAPELTTQSIGQDSLIPAKYRRQVVTTETRQLVDPDTVIPGSLTGDQTRITIEQRNVGESLQTITEEVIEESADPLVGEEVSDATQGQRATVTEQIVVDGTAADTGREVLSSSVDPLGNGKSIKTTREIPEYIALYSYERGVENLTPTKYRGQTTVRSVSEVDDPPVTPSTHEAPALTGDQTKIREVMETDSRMRREITEEVVDESADPLAGQRLDGRVTLNTVEQVVVDGTSIDTGSNVLNSRVVPLGNGKSIKETENWVDPGDEKLPFWDYISLPLLLFDISHAYFCDSSDFFTVVTNTDSTGGAAVLRKHRVTIAYHTSDPNPNLSTSTYVTRDIRYQGKFINFSFNNVLNDAISFSQAFFTGGGACTWTEAYSWSATSPSATTFAAGAWYTKDYRVEQFGKGGYRSTHTEFYSAPGNPSI